MLRTALTRPGACRYALALVIGIAVSLPWWPVNAQQMPPALDRPEAWLVTYGPGAIYWQRFGHNAIWIRDPQRQIDHLFNFGYFDFDQANFIGRFIHGKMLYFAIARSPEEEFLEYRQAGRSITAQRLDLNDAQIRRMEDYLIREVQPENRNYRYDYFLSNCSTRVRDVLDLALDGGLKAQWSEHPARRNFREHVNRVTAVDPGLYLGLSIGLGSPTDRKISRWQESFLPEVLQSLVDESVNSLAGGPLVLERRELLAGANTVEVSVWSSALRYILWGLVPTMLLSLIGMLAWRQGRGAQWLCLPAVIWSLLAGSTGLVLAYLWGFTDHQAAYRNWNLWILNPLLLLVAAALLFRPSGRVAGWAMSLLILGWAVAAIQLLPVWHQQDNLAAVALTAAPVLLSAMLLAVYRRTARNRSAGNKG